MIDLNLKRLSPLLYLVLMACLLSGLGRVQAQVDTEFWFVAPEVWANHGDSPTLLRFATFDQAAIVTVEQPANGTFPTQTISVPANSVSSLNLAPWLSLVENKPANTVLTKGLKITSTALIQAYYEVNPSNNLNPDIYALKGANALGTAFFVPFQNYLNNGYTQSPAGFDIVATEDNTTIEITPRKPIVGHPQNVTFTIALDAGETWSGRATSTAASQHPFGTVVNSDKPIAITISDDSLNGTPYGGCADLFGDQIVPIDIVGTEYIAIKGNLNGPDKVFFIPTEANTTISVNGNVVTTLNNLTSIYSHTLYANSAYYEASSPVYALHLTGFGCEVGGALLPPIVCTGSQEVAFIRSTNEFIGLKILVPAGGEDDFEFNGNPALINANQFSNVPGTDGEWKYANITASSFVPQLSASRLYNSTSNFHLGIINGGASSGTRYGYFSNYAAQAYIVQVDDNTLCEGDELELESNLLFGATYDWTGPNGFSGQGNPFPFGEVGLGDAGEYIVSGFVGACPIENDTLNLLVYPFPEAPEISGDSVVCEGAPLVLSTTPLETVQYQWAGPDGFYPSADSIAEASVTLDNDGIYTLVVNDHGCLSPPTLFDVEVIPQQALNISTDDATWCQTENFTLEALPIDGADYAWTNPDGQAMGNQVGVQVNNSQPEDSGWYTVQGEAEGCPLVPDSTWVEIIENPVIQSVDAPAVCLGNEATFYATYSSDGTAAVTWFDANGDSLGSGNPWVIAEADWADAQAYSVSVNYLGCIAGPEAFDFSLVPQQSLDILDANGSPIEADQICQGDEWILDGDGPDGTAWSWSGPANFNSSAQSVTLNNAQPDESGWYFVNGAVGTCPMLPDSVYLDVYPTPAPPVLSGFTEICEGSDWSLSAEAASDGTIQWFHPYWGAFTGETWPLDAVPLGAAGTYEVYVIESNCPSPVVTAELEIVPLPEVIAGNFGPIEVEHCPDNTPALDLPEWDPLYAVEWTYTDSDENTIEFGEGPGMVALYDGVYTAFLNTGAPCNLTAEGTFDVTTVLCALVVPNIISPNQDAQNERFALPDLTYFPFSTCRIFNRWGQVVYESQDFGNTAGWEPTPEEAVEGTYYYEVVINRNEGDLSITDENGTTTFTEPGPIRLVGSLTLVR